MKKKISSLSLFIAIVIAGALISAGYFGFSFKQEPLELSLGCKYQNPYYNVYFCPEDNCDSALIEQINSAEKTIHVAIYSFTLDDISDALISAHNRGIEVKVIMDMQQGMSEYSDYEKLKSAGIEVILDSNPDFMHNKFAIIDNFITLTGSYNWTDHATNGNDENLIIIKDTDVAGQYEAEFLEMWNIYS